MAIGIYFRTAYERIKTNFRDKKYDPIGCHFQIRGDLFPQAESRINPKDIIIGCLKFIAEDLTDIEILNIDANHKFKITRSENKCEIITEDVYVLIQNYNTYDYCTVHCHYANEEIEKSYNEITLTALIIDDICRVLSHLYQDYYMGRRKYNL